MKGKYLMLAAALLLIGACTRSGSGISLEKQILNPNGTGDPPVKKIIKSNEEWKKILTPEQYRVMRLRETETAFTGCYNTHIENGVYVCAACKTPLFNSGDKYDHGGPWPSFKAIQDGRYITAYEDLSHSMRRIEVRCAVCDSHLGHVFNDGPPPDGVHYCINSVALEFITQAEMIRNEKEQESKMNKKNTETAIFAAGCFWGVEDKFSQIDGVKATRVGYTGGDKKDPSYTQVCSGKTGHAEAIEIIFDPQVVDYEDLLDSFFRFHDPTQFNRQGADFGEQYRSAIFYFSEAQKNAAEKKILQMEQSGRFDQPIVTLIVPAEEFYKAEEYHQKYYEKLKKKALNPIFP